MKTRLKQGSKRGISFLLVYWLFLICPLISNAATIWSVSNTPSQPAVTDGQPIEIGVKFRADVAGTVTGVRFYKGAANTGLHVGKLWSRTGTLLASATFTNETASGWQQVQFASPVAIQAGTTYVASNHSASGYYAIDEGYFGSEHYSPPLRALSTGEAGGNGVYKYGTSGFPTQAWNASNYWVDVVFNPSTTGDTILPTVTAFSIPSTAPSLTVPITSFTATDNVGVSGYLVNESATKPSATAGGWSSIAQTSYTFSTAGSKTLYAWAKDAAGNVSASRSASVTVTSLTTVPEPAGWYAGDMHVHRSCGGPAIDMQTMYDNMAEENLSVMSLQADMGNGEVQDPILDLPKVNGQDDPISTPPGRIIHWDAEWHWDATYFQYPHQALGGHVLALGTSEAHQIWEESTSSIFEWAHQKGGIAGFAHMQAVGNEIPQTLNCCGPIEYPVEVALGAADFISEDVIGDDSFIYAYYRLLNTGFRPGFAAGSDFPCGADVGSLLTYSQVADGDLTHRKWIEGISQGRTVISRNGHNEFLQLTVNGNATPGDEINLIGSGSVSVSIQWTAIQNLTGTIELVQNGIVVANSQRSVSTGVPASLNATVNFAKSGWLAARRMSSNGHQVHTAAVFVTVDNAPVRASVEDAEFYVQWMDNLLEKTSPGGVWSSYFPTSLAQAQARYQQAKAVFQQIAVEASGGDSFPSVISVSPLDGASGVNTATVVRAVFSEPLDVTTINDTTFELRDAAGNLVLAAVNYSSTTNTATLTPFASLAESATYTAKVLGGSAGVTDTAGNPLASDRTWSFTTAGQQTSTSHSLWDGSVIPAIVSDPDSSAVELGVKFESSEAGLITGLRFYKSAANTGTHVGNLWSAGGSLLASVTFTNESGSGWQEMVLPTPVPISANTTYVASYHTNVGRYSANSAYFAGSGFDNPPLRALADGESGGNGVYRYGTSGFPNQTWNASNYWVDVVFRANTVADVTSPIISSTSPANNVLNVSTATVVTVIFNEEMDPATISGTTFGLKDAANASVSASVTYNPATKTATLTPTAVLVNSTIYTASVLGGTGGVTDLAGNPLSSNHNWSFTTAAASGGDTTRPVVTSNSPAFGAVGVSTAATVSVIFSEEMNSATISGTTFGLKDAASVPVTGSVTYDPATKTATLTPGSALANSTTYTATVLSGSIGVTDLAGNPLASDYNWSFTTQGSSGGDTTPPSILSALPPRNAPAVSTGTSLIVKFNEALSAASVNNTTFELRDASNALVPASVIYDASKNAVILKPTNPLSVSASHSAIVKGGGNGLKDEAGNPLVSDYAWSFQTNASSPYGSGPGGPILVITSASNPFSRYYAEILWNEGFNAFAIQDISAVSEAVLSNYDVVILGEITLTSAQTTLLTNWVNGGGRLIAMRPDKKLAGLLGLTDTGQSLSGGYLLVDSTSGPGAGIVGQTIQFHGTADRYTLVSAASLATLYSNAATATSNPAVTLRSVGSNGGQAAAFTYDLAHSIVLTRQGNPAWIGQERDGYPPIRSNDLFYGNATGDPQPDWIDLNKIAIPQADEQQRLLANMIIQMNAAKKPLPRFWYFPNGYEAVVIMTGDDHGNDGTAGRFDSEIVSSPANCALDRWECIRSSSYIYPDPAGAVTDSQAAAYDTAGFEIGLHGTTQCADYTANSLEVSFSGQMNTWQTLYPSLLPPVSHRMHCIAWSGFTTLPEEESKYGIRFDVNYYHFPADWVGNNPGFFTGSGMPMRFATIDGSLVDVYQAATQMTDESGQSYPSTVNSLLGKATGPEKYYGAFTANMHTDYVTGADYDALVASAVAHNVPVISARQMLNWLDARNGSSFGSLSWNGSVLNFTVSNAQGATGLTAMMPILSGYEITGITRNGNPISYDVSRVKGIDYAVFFASSGSYSVTTVTDTTPPAVSSHIPLSGAVGVNQGTAVTATFNEAMDAATINSTTFELRNDSNILVSATIAYNATTNTATLTPTAPLADLTTYTAVVRGGAGGVADTGGSPLAADFSWSFVTGGQGTIASTSIWGNTFTPAIPAAADTSAVELGVKFQSELDGYITGLRFYKGQGNSGTHLGNLWTSTGQLLASVTFANETVSGWQNQAFSTPVSIKSGTTYVASYHTSVGRYSINTAYFSGSGFASPPLRALADGENGGNGIYRYGASGFPNQTWNSANYWVDVVFATTLGPDTTAPTVSTTLPINGATNVSTATTVKATFSEAMDETTIDSDSFQLLNAGNNPIAAVVTFNAADRTATLTPNAALVNTATYTARVFGGPTGVTDTAGNPLTLDRSWSFTTAGQQSSTSHSLWNDSTLPTIVSDPDTDAVELGVKFESSENGYITGLRFYKSAANTGTHVGNLWSAGGSLLASVTFTNESGSGWQEMALPAPVAITANTTYLASYHTNVGRYSANPAYFAGSGFSNPPLRALADGENGGNGVYRYGSSGFPNQSWNASNYWVDVVFSLAE